MITKQRTRTPQGIKTANRKHKSSPYLFDAQTVRHFRLYVHGDTWSGAGNSTLFITAERGPDDPRHRYTLRRSLYSGALETIGEFQAFSRLDDARTAAMRLSLQEQDRW